MKKSLLFTLCALLGGGLGELHAAKVKKIVAQPSDAKIYIDGAYVGDGTFTVRFGSRDDFYFLKIEAPGYVTKEMRIFKNDTRNTIAVQLREDDSLEGSVATNLANQYFTIQVREGVDENLAWKMLSQVMLNYFDEMRTSDRASGYMNTAWVSQTFPTAQVRVRTRVQIKEITGDGLAYQIRISSEIAPMDTNEQSYKPWSRVLKKYEPLINEMQQRIGQN